jgi:hypothetical protein
VTWTQRNYTDLLRLLEKYYREVELPRNRTVEELYRAQGLVKPSEKLDDEDNPIKHAMDYLKFMEDKPTVDHYLLKGLNWWCDVVKDRYGKERFSAITWLVKQYYDKEGGAAFRRDFGANVDSVARRLFQKAKYYKDDARMMAERGAALSQAGDADMYELTFKILYLWREPRSM